MQEYKLVKIILKVGQSLYKTSHWISEGSESTLLDLQSFHNHVFLNTHASSATTAAVLQHAGSCMAA